MTGKSTAVRFVLSHHATCHEPRHTTMPHGNAFRIMPRVTLHTTRHARRTTPPGLTTPRHQDMAEYFDESNEPRYMLYIHTLKHADGRGAQLWRRVHPHSPCRSRFHTSLPASTCSLSTTPSLLTRASLSHQPCRVPGAVQYPLALIMHMPQSSSSAELKVNPDPEPVLALTLTLTLALALALTPTPTPTLTPNQVMYSRPLPFLTTLFKVNKPFTLEDAEDLDDAWLNEKLKLV